MPQLEDVIRAAAARAYNAWTEPEGSVGLHGKVYDLGSPQALIETHPAPAPTHLRVAALGPAPLSTSRRRAWESPLEILPSRIPPAHLGFAGKELRPPGLEALMLPRVGRRPLARALTFVLAAALALWLVFALGSRMFASEETVSLGGTIINLAVGYHSVWALTCDRCSDSEAITGTSRGRVLRIDPASMRVVATVSIRSPQGLAVGDGGVWVSTGWANSLIRIDPATDRVVATISLNLPFQVAPGDSRFGPQFLATGVEAIWAGTAQGALARVDPRTNQVVAIIRTPPGATGGLAAAEGDVWIAADVQGVLRVDAAANRIESTISVEAGQLLLAIDGVVEGDGAVWVGGAWTTKAVARGAADGPGDESVGNGAIARIDPRTSAVVATIPFARPATPLMPSGNVLWVESGGVLSRMDMRTNRVVGGELSPSGWVDPADKVLWVGTGTSMLTRVPLASVIRGVG